MTLIPLADTSKYQGVVNYDRFVANHIPGTIIRAGNGIDTDPDFTINAAAAKAHGINRAAYWFCNPMIGTAEQQGHALAAASRAAGCELPPMLDVENFLNEKHTLPPITGPALAAWLQKMADTITADLGRDPIIYSNQSYWNPTVGSNKFGRYDIIVARYPIYPSAAVQADAAKLNAWMASQPRVPADGRQWGDWIMAQTTARPTPPLGWTDWAGWQFSAGFNCMGSTYGVASRDIDLCIIRPEVWARWTGATAPPVVDKPTTPTPIPPTPPQEADMDVIIKNANGSAPRYRLQDEGTLRQLSEAEWIARGSIDGTPWSDAQIAAAGPWTPPAHPGGPASFKGSIEGGLQLDNGTFAGTVELAAS